ncbi:MAG: GNAT family N-acetyltransferase [Actinomycetota bacterium]
MSEVELRPANADLVDGERFARYLDQAADNTFRALLGRQSVRIVAEAFLAPGHDLSHQYVTVAEIDGEVVGMLSGYSADQHAASTDQPLEDAAGFRKYRMAVLHRIGARIFDFMDRLPDGDWYVQAVAVDQSGRGKGVGSALLQNAEQTARTAGCERITLDVAVNNDRARRLYERLGYEAESSSKPIPLVPSAAVHRMAKPL